MFSRKTIATAALMGLVVSGLALAQVINTGSSGGSSVDLTAVKTNIVPNVTGTRDLGSATRMFDQAWFGRWMDDENITRLWPGDDQGNTYRGDSAGNASAHSFTNNQAVTTGCIADFYDEGFGTQRLCVEGSGKLDFDSTDSTATPGNVTINKPAGKAAVAATASQVTVTNSLVTSNSMIIITPQSLDSSCYDYRATPGSGSFTVAFGAACSAQWNFAFLVVD